MSKLEFTSIPQVVSQATTSTFPQGSQFVMGVSGGSDSMALLYLFYTLKQRVFVVHINYGLRGTESDADQELVEGMAAAWGFDCCSVRLDYEEASGNFQNWARDQRYQILEDVRHELDAQAIVVAHHQDDQVETILQKVLRGSSPQKWQGLSVWDGRLFRPLLEVSKAQVLAYCEKEAVPYRIDRSNFEEKYARNKLRGSVSEGFDELFPGWRQNILALSERGRQTHEAMQFMVAACKKDGGLDLAKLQELSADLLPAVLKQFVESETGATLTQGEIGALVHLPAMQVGKVVQLSNGSEIVRGRGLINIKKTATCQKEVMIWPQETIKGVEACQFFIQQGDAILKEGSLTIDFDSLKWPLTLRTWKPGDRFQPLGMVGSQKVSDHLVHRKVAASEKHESLILTGADGTIYVVFFPTNFLNGQKGTISEQVKITETTISALTIIL